MRKWILFIVLALAVLLTACAGKQPQISLETTEFDFGDVVNGEIVSRDLIVRNVGQADLIVEEVITTCGCTTGALDPMTIPPGGEATLHIEFDSGAHGPELTGELMRQVILVSNDPEAPEATVQFTANVVPPEN